MTLREAGSTPYTMERYELFVRHTPEQQELALLSERPMTDKDVAEEVFKKTVSAMQVGSLAAIEVVLLGPNGYIQSAKKAEQ